MSGFRSIPEIQAEVDRLAPRLGLAPGDMRVQTTRDDMGGRHVEVDEAGYHYIAAERGRETNHDASPELDDLLYWIFRDAAQARGLEYEMHHREPREDFRRLYFGKAVELLAQVDPRWGARLQADWDDTLAGAPFEDVGRTPEELRASILRDLPTYYLDLERPDLGAARSRSPKWGYREMYREWTRNGADPDHVVDVTDVSSDVCLSYRARKGPERLLLQMSCIGIAYAAVWRISGLSPFRPRFDLISDDARTPFEEAVTAYIRGLGDIPLRHEELEQRLPLKLPGRGDSASAYEALFSLKPPSGRYMRP